MSDVGRYLVTASFDDRMDVWAATALVSNWIEGRGPDERQTWMVTVVPDGREGFLEVAGKRAGVTVEEIVSAGEDETYRLLVGESGTGWGGGNQ
jgi:hypothetical protein